MLLRLAKQSLQGEPIAHPSPVRAAPAPQKAIALHDINVVFQTEGSSFQALHQISLEVNPGTVQLIMGPAGAGKTTLLQVVAGLLTPTSGQVELLGTNLTQMPRAAQAHFRCQHLGIVFQDYNLLRSLTALENVEMVLSLKGISGAVAQREARQLLNVLGLGNRMNCMPKQLSGGQQQRVAVARALVGAPELIVADEPTSALDSANGRKVMELLCQMARDRGTTVLMATHDHRVAEFGDAIAYLEDGKLRQEAIG